MLGVYIHIPFCESKCHYCAFSSFVKNAEEQQKYMSSLIEEIQSFSQKQTIDSIYIGGGTPSLVSTNEMQKLFDCLKNCFIWNKNIEFTIEANPCSLTKEKLEFYKENGVNRLSIGVQSLENEKLKAIGRRHNSQEAVQAIKLAGKYFNNISCDMLIGLPDMDKSNFLSQIEYLISLNIKHISAYMLQVENGTLLSKMIDNKEIILPDDDQCVEAYEDMAKLLNKYHFQRYEVSNFALKGFESKHNFKYWTGEDYIGFGLGAHSYINGVRFANSSSFEGFYKRTISQKEVLTNQQKIEEHIMLGLRCKAGINKEFLKKNGYLIEKNENFIEFVKKGILNDGEIISLNPQYYGVSNYIISSILP